MPVLYKQQKFHFFFSNLYYTQILKTKAFGIDINFASILSDSMLNLQSNLDRTDILITIIVLFVTMYIIVY